MGVLGMIVCVCSVLCVYLCVCVWMISVHLSSCEYIWHLYICGVWYINEETTVYTHTHPHTHTLTHTHTIGVPGQKEGGDGHGEALCHESLEESLIERLDSCITICCC